MSDQPAKEKQAPSGILINVFTRALGKGVFKSFEDIKLITPIVENLQSNKYSEPMVKDIFTMSNLLVKLGCFENIQEVLTVHAAIKHVADFVEGEAKKASAEPEETAAPEPSKESNVEENDEEEPPEMEPVKPKKSSKKK